jgi:hypothetical protein
VFQRTSFRISHFPNPEDVEELLRPILVVGIHTPKLDELVLPVNHECHYLGVGISMGHVTPEKVWGM